MKTVDVGQKQWWLHPGGDLDVKQEQQQQHGGGDSDVIQIQKNIRVVEDIEWWNYYE